MKASQYIQGRIHFQQAFVKQTCDSYTSWVAAWSSQLAHLSFQETNLRWSFHFQGTPENSPLGVTSKDYLM